MADGAAAKAGRSLRLERLGSMIARRPRRVVAVWLVLLLALGLLSLDLESRVSTRAIFFSGTETKREHEIAVRQFGSETAVVVLLRGPHALVESQGRELERFYGAKPGTLVVSPWTRSGSIEGLNPSPGVAALVVNVRGHPDDDITKILPEIQQGVDQAIAPPVHAGIAGAPAVVESIQTANAHAVELGQWIAIPALMIILLLVFRSVFAALIPILSGGAVVIASRGALDALARLSHVEVLAIGAMGMMGLALGVDYSLLIVSRFREEMEKGADLPDAIASTVASTGRTVLMAGAGLSLAMLVAPAVLSGSIVSSVSYAVLIATVLSVLSALFVVPALMTMLGTGLDRWTLPRRKDEVGIAARLSARFTRRPRLVVVPIIVFLAAASAWALTLDTGALAVAQLPPGDPGRVQQEEVQRALGPGWVAPMEVAIEDRDGPITTPSRLHALADFQRRVERDPGVETVTDIGGLASAARGLEGVESQLTDQERSLAKLGGGITRMRRGARLNTAKLWEAATGATRIDSAVGVAGGGANTLSKGLRAAAEGSDRMTVGLGRAGGGSGNLAHGAAHASKGVASLNTGLARARRETGRISSSTGALEDAMQKGGRRLDEADAALGDVDSNLGRALESLRAMTSGAADPQYRTALEAVESANARLGGVDPQTGAEPDDPSSAIASTKSARGQLSLGQYLSARLGKSGEKAGEGIAKLVKGSAKLDGGLRRLEAGAQKLDAGIAKLSEGGRALSPALSRLRDGAERLSGGLGAIGRGTGAFATGLEAGSQQSKRLVSGLSAIDRGLEGGGGESSLGRLRRQSPGLFHSGYFYLAGLDGIPPQKRRQAEFLVNLEKGGSTARLLVVSHFDPSDPRAKETRQRLEGDAQVLARRIGADVAVGGATASQQDINTALRAQTPLARLVLALVTIVILVFVLRSLLLPVLAGLLNLLTVAATFGILSLLFNGSLLGGPGFVDTTVLPATIVVIFGLAIDYEVFVFARMREEYIRTGSTETAITEGVIRTAPVVSGAAIVMIVVFLSFSVSSFSTMRNFGVAQAIGVTIDAFVIRLVVVPAIMRMLGRWSWWMPAWLDRLLPGVPNAVALPQGEAA